VIDDLILAPALRADLATAACSAYPEECCGVLLGTDLAASRPRIAEIAVLPNEAPDRLRRFALSTAALANVSRQHRGRHDVVGFFHSHPNGRAWPSQADLLQASAWPGYLHAIASITADYALVIKFFRVHDRCWAELYVGAEPDG
jgi:proteasome lid subunit RPN8/RPN11